MSPRRLVLIRHAKTGEGSPDEQRALTDRGHRDAAAIGRWLLDAALVPDRVLTSPARRARQTWADASRALRGAPEPVVDERIYDNTPELLLEIVRETPPQVTTLVLVGHNPAFGTLARMLDDGGGQSAAREALAAGYPTSATAVYAVTGTWAKIGIGRARLESFASPRG